MKGWGRAKPRHQASDVVVYRMGIVRSGRGCSGATHGWVGVIARSSHQLDWQICHRSFWGTLPAIMPIILPTVHEGAALRTTRHKYP